MVYSPIADVKEYPEEVDVALVEGAVANEENLRPDPSRSAGTRRIWSRSATARSPATSPPCGTRSASAEHVLSRAYLEGADIAAQIPADPGIVPVLLDRVLPVHEVVPVDTFLPGCPPPADRIRAVLEQLLAGKAPVLTGRDLKAG